MALMLTCKDPFTAQLRPRIRAKNSPDELELSSVPSQGREYQMLRPEHGRKDDKETKMRGVGGGERGRHVGKRLDTGARRRKDKTLGWELRVTDSTTKRLERSSCIYQS